MKQIIRVNVYDILDVGLLKKFGFGLYHTGVQIGKCSEYEYNDLGISVIAPKSATGVTFSHSIDIASIKSCYVIKALREMHTEFSGDNYDILSRNCNHFTEQFVYKLTKYRTPKYINSVASLFAYDKNKHANNQFIKYMNESVNLKWFPITNTMIDLANDGVLNDEILQIGILNSQYEVVKNIHHKKYIFEETIYGFKVHSKYRPLIANIWLFDIDPNNEKKTVYCGPKKTFLVNKFLRNECIQTRNLTNVFVYRYIKTDVFMFENACDYIKLLYGAPDYNIFIRFLLTGHLSFKELIRVSENTPL